MNRTTKYNYSLTNYSSLDPTAFSSLNLLFRDFLPLDTIADRIACKFFPDIVNVFGQNFFENNAYPRVDIRETDTQFVIEAEIPFLNKDQIKVEIKDDILSIRGEKRSDFKKEGNYIVRERKMSSFSRSWKLPSDIVDKNSVKARYENGVLEITIDKIKPTPPPKKDSVVINIE